jgi:hypothetical protein
MQVPNRKHQITNKNQTAKSSKSQAPKFKQEPNGKTANSKRGNKRVSLVIGIVFGFFFLFEICRLSSWSLFGTWCLSLGAFRLVLVIWCFPVVWFKLDV